MTETPPLKIATAYLENGATHTLNIPFKDEAEVKEIVLDSMERMTGLPREKLVRIERIEIKSYNPEKPYQPGWYKLFD